MKKFTRRSAETRAAPKGMVRCGRRSLRMIVAACTLYDAFGHMIMKDPASRRDPRAGSARRGGPRTLIVHPGNTGHGIPARAMVRGGHGGPGRPGVTEAAAGVSAPVPCQRDQPVTPEARARALRPVRNRPGGGVRNPEIR